MSLAFDISRGCLILSIQRVEILIKTLIGRVKPDAGEVRLGHKVQVGYHDQGLESLPPETTVVRAGPFG